MRKNIMSLLIVLTGILFAASTGIAAESGQSASQVGAAGLSGAASSYHRGDLKSTFGERSDAGRVDPQLEPQLDARALRVLSLVEQKTSDQKVLSHIRYKLSTVSEDRLRMISSLSDRILSRGGEAEAHVAFLLLTALIVFS